MPLVGVKSHRDIGQIVETPTIIVGKENYLENLRKGFMSDNRYLSEAVKTLDRACIRQPAGYNSSYHFVVV